MVKAKKNNNIFSDFNQVQSRSVSEYFSPQLDGESVMKQHVIFKTVLRYICLFEIYYFIKGDATIMSSLVATLTRHLPSTS